MADEGHKLPKRVHRALQGRVVHALLEHDDFDVRIEAMRALVDALQDQEARELAVQCCGRYCLIGAVRTNICVAVLLGALAQRHWRRRRPPISYHARTGLTLPTHSSSQNNAARDMPGIYEL